MKDGFYKFIESEPGTSALQYSKRARIQHDPKNNLAHSLDDSDLVGDVQGVVVRGKADVGLLISSGSHQCVDLEGFNVVTEK